jgi:drug/metabolite transporter (DMT)-like permease
VRLRELLALLVLGALWGASFLFIRVAVPELGPFLLGEVRVAVAGVMLVAYAFAFSRLPGLRKMWKGLLVLGALQAALPFVLIPAAELHLTASLAAIINSTTAMFTAVVAAFWLGEPLTARKGVGVVLGVFGVALLVGWDPIPLTAVVLLSVGAVLAASLSYAVAAVYAKRTFAGIPPLTLAVGQQLSASALLLAPAAATLPDQPPSVAAVASVLALAVFSTSLAYLLFYYLIENAGPTAATSVTLIVPVFGLLFGALLLREPVGIGTVVGLLVVLFSVALVVGVRVGAPGGKAG